MSAMSASPEMLGLIGQSMTALAQAQALDFRLVSVGHGEGSVQVPWREDIVGDLESGVIAGGVVTTLLDHVCGMSVKTLVVESVPIATLDLRIDYMRPAAPRHGVAASAHCYKLTRSIAFVRGQAWDTDPNDPIATAQAAFAITRRPE